MNEKLKEKLDKTLDKIAQAKSLLEGTAGFESRDLDNAWECLDKAQRSIWKVE